MGIVVPYIGTWIETTARVICIWMPRVVPYIGTWIETPKKWSIGLSDIVVPYIGTWIETTVCVIGLTMISRRTLYRYVD